MTGSIWAKWLQCFLYKIHFLAVNRWENTSPGIALYTITEWWPGNVNFNGFHQQYKANKLPGRNVNKSKAAFQVKATETFLFNNIKGELTGWPG
jgi:hypothetical protein